MTSAVRVALVCAGAACAAGSHFSPLWWLPAASIWGLFVIAECIESQ